MEEKDIEQIERYFRHALEEEERAAFERRMAEDAGFAREVQLHGLAMEAIRMEGEAILRARLAQKGQELDQRRAAPGKRKWLWVIPVVLVGGLVIWQFARPLAPAAPAPAAPAPVGPPPAVPPAPPRDTLPPAPPPREEPEARARIDVAGHERELFAAWFEPYRDDSIDPSVRGGRYRVTPSERVQQMYWDGDFRAVLSAFDSLGTRDRNDDNLLFLRANCLLDSGRSEEAARLLEAIIQNDRSRFVDQASWYLALAYLHAGDSRGAKALLRRLSADTASPRQTDARRVLQAME